MKLKDTPWEESYDQPRQHIEKQRHHFANKGPSSQGYGFSSGRIGMWELDCEESWALKNWCFWTVVLEETLESPLDCKEIQLVHSKGDQSWVFIRRTDAKAETPVLWPPHAKNWLIGKDSDAGRDWGQEEMAAHSSILAWRIPGTGEPGGLPSMESHRVGHNWSDLAVAGEGDDRGWDGSMASVTQWMWVWVNSGSWWRTGRPGVLRFMGLQRVGHDWATELNWILHCMTYILSFHLSVDRQVVSISWLLQIMLPWIFSFFFNRAVSEIKYQHHGPLPLNSSAWFSQVQGHSFP